MRRTGVRIANLLGISTLAICPLALAQDFSQPPNSPTPDEMPGTRLIVWTEMQKPHPLPETSTKMYAASEQAQLLSGTILAHGPDLFFVGANHPAYRIENENNNEEIRGLDEREVRIYGNVDSRKSVIYVLSIEP